MLCKKLIAAIGCLVVVIAVYAQPVADKKKLALIRQEGFQHSQAKAMLSTLSDVYGQRLTGSREYLAAANWAAGKMKAIGLDNVHFENYCADCRGWSINSFNAELVAPNYMHLVAYPEAMSKSTQGIVEGDVISIESIRDLKSVKEKFTGKLSGRIILLGKEPKTVDLTEPLLERYDDESLQELEGKLKPGVKQTPLPEQIESWKVSDHAADSFFLFAEQQGALAVLITGQAGMGILHVQGNYNYRDGHPRLLPTFVIIPEHFGRLYRMLKQQVVPKVRLNMDVTFYIEPQNNVNIIGEIPGSDPKLKSEEVIIGGHFDSWHSGTGATDNGVSCVVLMEALRLLKANGITPKRTIKIALWGGEEQAFLGSVAYAESHYGKLAEQPNEASKKVSVYLNLDNGGGAIRGIYLQGNELARPVFNDIFSQLHTLIDGTVSIENTLATDHETFDHYNIPAFQFIQDALTYETVTHHTQLDLPEYVPEEDMMKNAVILAWTIYALADMDSMVPRKPKP